MHRHTVDRLGRAAILALGVLAALLWSVEPAAAKGPSSGVIEGPGLDAPVELREPGAGTIGPLLSTMVMESGFFPAAFGGDGMSARPPLGDLGLRYTVTYTFEGQRNDAHVVMALYPFAEPDPVTYTAPGQRFWGSETPGGWYRARLRLRHMVRGIIGPDPVTVADTDHAAPAGGVSWDWLPAAVGATVVVVGSALFLRSRTLR